MKEVIEVSVWLHGFPETDISMYGHVYLVTLCNVVLYPQRVPVQPLAARLEHSLQCPDVLVQQLSLRRVTHKFNIRTIQQ